MLAVIQDPKVVRRILEHLKLPAEAPKLEPAHEEPQGTMWLTGPPVDGFDQQPAPDE